MLASIGCVFSNSSGSMGFGVKQRTNIKSAPQATRRRLRSRGMWSSSVFGCRMPKLSNMTIIRTVHTNQLREKKVRTIVSPTVRSVKNVDRRPKTA